MCTSSVSNEIYHKFSHGATFYMLNEKNVNVMLEYMLIFFVEKMLEALHCKIFSDFFQHKISVYLVIKW